MTVEGDAGAKPGDAPHAMKITAAVVPARSQPFEIQQLDLAAPLADEVLVRIVASGLCHTDLHARDGYFPNLPYPIVCGHEGAGIVEEVGAAVTDLAAGDPVVISFPYCGECEPCQAGRISYCTNARGLKSGGRRADGSTPMSRDGAPVYSCFFQQSSFATFALELIRFQQPVIVPYLYWMFLICNSDYFPGSYWSARACYRFTGTIS